MCSPHAENQPADSHAGLCRSCLYARVVRTGRGSTFYLCRRSVNDPRFVKYPRLPVIQCPGFEKQRSGMENGPPE